MTLRDFLETARDDCQTAAHKQQVLAFKHTRAEALMAFLHHRQPCMSRAGRSGGLSTVYSRKNRAPPYASWTPSALATHVRMSLGRSGHHREDGSCVQGVIHTQQARDDYATYNGYNSESAVVSFAVPLFARVRCRRMGCEARGVCVPNAHVFMRADLCVLRSWRTDQAATCWTSKSTASSIF
jgi:hypothetical protein